METTEGGSVYSENTSNVGCRRSKSKKHFRSPIPPMPPGSDLHLRKVWRNYWEARSWQHRHQVACWRSQVEALQYENQMLHEYIKVLLTGSPEDNSHEMDIPSDEQAASPTPSQRAKRNRKRRIRRKRKAKTKDHMSNESAEGEIDSEEVDEELLNFMEQTIRHRFERDNHPLLEKNRDKNQDRKVDPESMLQPQETLVRNHVQEMQDLFGQAAPKLLAMETAMQLTFNSNCDRHHPKLWPVLPLSA